MLAGLSTDEATRRFADHGPNAVPSQEARSWAQLVWAIVREPMVLLIIAAATIYVVFGDVVEALALAAAIGAILTIDLVQQRRTETALAALRELASPTARVLRDGAWRVLDARLLVPGDAVQIAEGDRVPADARLVDGTLVSVDESLLTGESVPVVRDPERGDLAHAGTLITSGHAIAEVVATGEHTELGKIGATLKTLDTSTALVQRQITRLVKRIAVVAIALSLGLVLIRGLGGSGWLAAALSGITLAISLIPEEFPVVLAVFFALGARRIARHGVLARRSSAIETLGAVTVLCVDKTGTLTENEMTIARLVTAADNMVPDADAATLPEEVHEVVEFGVLACPRHPTDPMDRAFSRLAESTLQRTEHLHPRWVPVREYPLRTGLLAVTHAWQGDSAHLVVATKGAPEAIFDLCHLPPDELAKWRRRVEPMARAGERVLGVARATYRGAAPPENPHDYEFEIVGLVGLADPVRADTAEMVQRCRGAGIRVMMLTGDHPETARAIAHAAGIQDNDVLSGTELEQLDDAALAARLRSAHVVARAVPAHKLRIVRALQAGGDVVGMTGDGVNDAPALAAADIGIAMGGRGSDVAREAAGLILVEDNLGAIVEAVRTGRAIYDNVRASVGYLLSVHIPIAGIALLPPLLGWGMLMTPLHVVVLELVIGPACSIVFEQEPAASDILDRPPRPRDAKLLGFRDLARSAAYGLLALTGTLLALSWQHAAGSAHVALSTIALYALVAGNLAILVASRPRVFARNAAVPVIMSVAAAIALLMLAVPPVTRVLGLTWIGGREMAIAVAAGALPVLAFRTVSAVRTRLTAQDLDAPATTAQSMRAPAPR
jgi:Ca2+-transporting ATPase